MVYVTVRFGEMEEGIFNPHCRCITLLMNIRDKCLGDDAEVELSDENGNVKNLRDWPHRYASDLLQDRERLVLLKVDRRDAGDTMYVPMLNDAEYVNETFLSQLASKAHMLRPSSSRRARTPNSRRTAAGRGVGARGGQRDAKDGGKQGSSKGAGAQPSRAKSRLK